jgi:hypothetical protein
MKSLIFILLISFVGQAQIKVIDNASQKPINSVEIYNKKGVLLGTTNEFGLCPNLSSGDYPITLSHFLYANQVFQTPSEILKLSPKSMMLQEVVVHADKHKYIILEGYFRGFQTKNDSLDLYADSQIKWILTAKNYKPVGYEVIASRYYRSKNYMLYKQKNISFAMKNITLPQLTVDLKKFQTSKVTEKIYQILFKENQGKEEEIKFLGNSSKILIHEDELFTTSEHAALENLLFFNHKSKLIFSPKKSANSDRYEALIEFLPSQIYFSDELPPNIQKRIIIKEKSNYRDAYWEIFERNPNFKQLTTEIKNALAKTMDLIN